MAYYENTIVAKQDLADKDLKTIKDKYNELIDNASGKVIKIEEWGLLNLANKIKNYKNKMIDNIAKLCELPASQINIKGKTTEKLGVIGKEKAIACEVIASVIKYD